MQTIYGRNMPHIIPQGVDLLLRDGETNGHLTEITNPVAMMVTEPTERLSYGTGYDLNPFAAMFTALWALGGRNDVYFLARFDAYKVGTSDDGKTLHGAYGKRIRGHFWVASDSATGTIDQLKSVVQMLRNDPGHKSAVIALWDAGEDMGYQSKNLPAATHLYFNINHAQRLDMMVTYRDIDIFDMRLDAVVFSMVQEYIASAISIATGRMTIFANRFATETKVLELIKDLPRGLSSRDLYKTEVSPWPLVSIDSGEWLSELDMFLDEGPVMGLTDPFFRRVAGPMWQAWGSYRETAGIDTGGPRRALDTVSRVQASDWKEATTEWLLRRIDERT